MGCALEGLLPLPLLLLLLPPPLLLFLLAPGSHGLSCSASSVNWTAGLTATCLNFSGQELDMLPNELQASNLEYLDLSRNRLQHLPGSLFASLGKLQVLDVTGNPLFTVSGTLGALCALELRADCACALVPWHQARANCSEAPSLQCQVGFNYTQNLTLFLKTHCPEGLSTAAIGGLAAGGCVLLALGIAGSWLAHRLRDWRARGTQSLGKMLTASSAPSQGSSQQTRYGSRAQSPQAPMKVQLSPVSPDYENMFQGEPAQPRWDDRPQSANDSDFYMEFEEQSAESGPHAIYCNLPTLQPEAEQDEEDYVVPGR
ncbi:leucine-rich repeat-containing protein 25 [Sorex araneus]|uniref:leucine-rich repeat-containing protein 25 n=1 Tax=Sorex araneus TaxID=42254 RepID=UPI0024335F8A|nr:leucine-rich repeat-containing protein 25 [Sorex araneus]